jgi:hypothetical protein
MSDHHSKWGAKSGSGAVHTFETEPSFKFRLKLALGGGPGVVCASFWLRFGTAGSGLLSCSGTSDGAVKKSDEDFSKGFSSAAFGDFGDFGCFATGGKTNGEELFMGIERHTRGLPVLVVSSCAT